MRDKAAGLLSSGEVKRVLAWKKSDLPWLPEPAFFSSPEALSDMVYDKFCSANLSKYLVDVKNLDGQTLVFLRPCDSFSYNVLVKENQINSENIITATIDCEGCVSVDEGEERGLFESCETCTKNDKNLTKKRPRFAEVEQVEAMNSNERYDFWRKQFKKCIRCNACRNICPACNCKKCVFENTEYDTPQKVNVTSFEEQMFHIVRAYHVTGRCTDCGQCSRACPQNVPLHLLNRKFIKDINELFGEFQAGADTETPSPLTSFNINDDPEVMQ